MEAPLYYLWHTQRQGWMQTFGGTTTVLVDAGKFTRAAAETRVHASRDHEGNHVIIPVLVGDII